MLTNKETKKFKPDSEKSYKRIMFFKPKILNF